MCKLHRTFVVLFTLQGKKSDKEKANVSGGTGAKPKSGESSKAVDAKPSSAGRASDNASDTLFAGLADNKMLQ